MERVIERLGACAIAAEYRKAKGSEMLFFLNMRYSFRFQQERLCAHSLLNGKLRLLPFYIVCGGCC